LAAAQVALLIAVPVPSVSLLTVAVMSKHPVALVQVNHEVWAYPMTLKETRVVPLTTVFLCAPGALM
jgi:hypothetical protein